MQFWNKLWLLHHLPASFFIVLSKVIHCPSKIHEEIWKHIFLGFLKRFYKHSWKFRNFNFIPREENWNDDVFQLLGKSEDESKQTAALYTNGDGEIDHINEISGCGSRDVDILDTIFKVKNLWGNSIFPRMKRKYSILFFFFEKEI